MRVISGAGARSVMRCDRRNDVNNPNRSKAASKSALQRAPDLISPNPLSCRPGKGKRMHFDRLSRRDFIRLVGCAAISP